MTKVEKSNVRDPKPAKTSSRPESFPNKTIGGIAIGSAAIAAALLFVKRR